MANSIVRLPLGYFPDPNIGRPIFRGKIYVGEPDLNPRIEANRKVITGLQEDGTEVTLSQPISTSAGGVPVDGPNGTGNPVTLLVDGAYALAVDDRNDNPKYSFANVAQGAPVTFEDNVVFYRATLADAVADTSITVGSGVITGGYTDENDGGGETYTVVAGNTGTVDGGTYINMDSGFQLQRVVGESLNLKSYGVTFDGVTDDSTQINAALAAAPFGSKIVWGSGGETTLIGAIIRNENAAVWDLNGCTIQVGGDLLDDGGWIMQFFNLKQGATDITGGSTISEGDISFTIPSEVTVEVGDTWLIRSTASYTSNATLGIWAYIEDVTAGVATMRTPSPVTFTIEVMQGYNGPTGVEIYNGTIIYEPNEASTSNNLSASLIVRSSDVNIRNVSFIGGQYAGVGVQLNGDTALVENCNFDGFLHRGNPDPRLGYGVNANANNTTVKDCSGKDCKHVFTVAGSFAEIPNVLFDNLKAYTFESTNQSAPIDFHSTGISPVARNCTVIGSEQVVNLRTDATYENCTITRRLANTNFATVSVYDQAVTNGLFKGCKITNESGGNILDNAENPLLDENITNLRFIDCEIINPTGLVLQLSQSSAATISGLMFKGCDITALTMLNINSINIIEYTDIIDCTITCTDLCDISVNTSASIFNFINNTVNESDGTGESNYLRIRENTAASTLTDVNISGNSVDTMPIAFIRFEDFDAAGINISNNYGRFVNTFISSSFCNIDGLTLNSNNFIDARVNILGDATVTYDNSILIGNTLDTYFVTATIVKTNVNEESTNNLITTIS